MTSAECCVDLDAWLYLDIGEMGLFKTEDEEPWLYYFMIRKETLGYRVCTDHHFTITSYIEKIAFPGQKEAVALGKLAAESS